MNSWSTTVPAAINKNIQYISFGNIEVTGNTGEGNVDVTMSIPGNKNTVNVKPSDFQNSMFEMDPRDQCFSADAKIILKNNSNKNEININIEDVNIGDNILVGLNKYRPVIGFSHRNSDIEFDFLCIKYIKNNDKTNQETFHISSEHLIPASNSENSKLEYIRAIDLKSGMFIQNVCGDKINQVQIIDISEVKKRGLFCIHTDNYDVVIDNIIVSSYTSKIDIKFAHKLISFANIFPSSICAYLIENIPKLKLV